jgi:hypothetical protein
VVDRQVEQLLGAAHRAAPEADAAVVEDLHRHPKALAGLAEHVLGRHADVLEVEPPQVIRPQAHGVVALAHLEALHPLLQQQRDVPVLAAHLGPGEGGDHVGSGAIADVSLLSVQEPGAVGLLDRSGTHVVGVRSGLRLGQREGGELPAGGEIGEEALLLLVRAEERDPLEADRLVDAEHDREGGVDLADGFEDPCVSRLREALPSILLLHIEPERPDLPEVAEHLVRDPPLLLRLPRVVVIGAVLADLGVDLSNPVLF